MISGRYIGCRRFPCLALLPVFDFIYHFYQLFLVVRFSYLALVQGKKITCVLPANACCIVYVTITFTQYTKIRNYFFWLTWRGNNSHCLHDRLFPCLALLPVFDFIPHFYQLFLVSCLFVDSCVLLADDHVNNVSYFPFMSIKKRQTNTKLKTADKSEE
jgi:hypothetical protein